MTVTYPNGTKVECLLLSAEGDNYRVAVAGDKDFRLFRQIDGVWRSEDGQPVKLTYGAPNGMAVGDANESHLTCSRELGKQLISLLMNGGPEEQEDAPGAFYVFSSQDRQVHITVLRPTEARPS